MFSKMKNDLLLRVIVFLIFIILGLLVAEVPRIYIAGSLVVIGFFVFFKMAKMDEKKPESSLDEDESDELEEDPFKPFLNQSVVVYLYGGDKIKGKLVSSTVSYGCTGAIHLKDAQFFKDFDSGDFPQSRGDNLHDDAVIPMDHIVTVAKDDLDRVSSS